VKYEISTAAMVHMGKLAMCNVMANIVTIGQTIADAVI